MRLSGRGTALAFAAAVAVRIGFHVVTGFTADDALITFRYAENLAAGEGLVYNPGEAVLGTSTPLFTLLLAAGARVVPVPGLALALLLLASGIIAALLYRLAVDLRFGAAAWLPPAVYAAWPRSLAADVGGMETALFGMWILAGFAAAFRRRWGLALVLASLATLTRIEGCFLVGILGIGALVREHRAHRRRDPAAPALGTLLVRLALPPILILGPWFLWAWHAYGSPLPHSIPAKLALYENFFREPFLETWIRLLAWHNPVGWILSASAVAGTAWLLRTRRHGAMEAAWVLAMFVFFATGRTHLFFWYVVPIYPVYLLLATAAVPAALEWVPAFRRRSRLVLVVVAVATAAVLGLGARRQAVYFRDYQHRLDRVHAAIGRYLSDHAMAGDLVAAEDIGYIGYVSGKRILDRDGLVSPSVVPYNREGRYRAAVLDHDPDWIVAWEGSPTSTWLDDPEVTARYETVRIFDEGTDGAYRLLRRRG